MTDQQINQTIAEAIGWQFIPEYCHGDDLPDFAINLNAMHDAEKVLIVGTANEVIHATNRYTKELCRILGCLDTALFHFAHATARERAEAFLRTIGKWEESES